MVLWFWKRVNCQKNTQTIKNKKPFIILNGALLDSQKYELELFGEEKENGIISYGALEKANKGTLQ